MALRCCSRISSSTSLLGLARFGSALSVLDFVGLGSSLSLRGFGRLGSNLAVLDFLQLGSSLRWH